MNGTFNGFVGVATLANTSIPEFGFCHRKLILRSSHYFDKRIYPLFEKENFVNMMTTKFLLIRDKHKHTLRNLSWFY
jgi:hypothetical protein